MVELMIAIAIGGVILAGAVAILRPMIVSTGDSSDESLARFEVQSVDFWIGDDVVQAQSVSLGNSSNGGFPLIINWTTPQPTTITYDVETMKDNLDRDLWRLYRTNNSQKATVAEYLDPLLTSCSQKQLGNGTLVNVLVLNVASQVDRQSASGSYEINPRFGNVTWAVTP
jgi:hypothetical protein